MKGTLRQTRHRLLQAMGVTPVAMMMTAGALGGCGEEPELTSDDASAFALELETAAVGVSQSPPPGVLQLNVTPTIDAGTYQTASVFGVTPGVPVFLLVSQTPGPGPCPPVLGGTCLEVSSPRVLGSGVAGVSGQVDIEFSIPARLAEGSTLYFQAASPGAGATGDTSPVVDVGVTYPPRVCGDHPFLTPSTVSSGFVFLACAPIPGSGVCPSYNTFTSARADWLFERNSGQSASGLGGGWAIFPYCDETTVETECCYGMEVNQWVIGRPFQVGGAPRVADAACRPGWGSSVAVDLSGLNRRARRRLARAWTRTAQGEHASVAAFSRFVLQLMALGAPADLVADATQAMADEIRHAKDAFEIASVFAGAPVGPAELDTAESMDAMDWESVVLDTVREGCIAETIAASQAAVARDACTDPAIRAVLDGVADDEARHAELAWRFVRWALVQRPELAPKVEAVFAEGLTTPPVGVDGMAETIRAYGALSEPEMQRVAHEVFQEVVLPCASGLLGRVVSVGLAA